MIVQLYASFRFVRNVILFVLLSKSIVAPLYTTSLFVWKLNHQVCVVHVGLYECGILL